MIQPRYLFEDKYDAEETEKILKILNSSKEDEEFKKFITSHKRINEVLKLRDDKGGFSSLDDLIPIMGTKVSTIYNPPVSNHLHLIILSL